MVAGFFGRPTNLETNSISYYRQVVSGTFSVGMGHNWDAGTPDRCTFTGPADQVEKAKEAFQFQIDLVRAGKTTTTPGFYKMFQQTILENDFLGMIKDHDEEQRKKARDDFLQTFPI